MKKSFRVGVAILCVASVVFYAYPMKSDRAYSKGKKTKTKYVPDQRLNHQCWKRQYKMTLQKQLMLGKSVINTYMAFVMADLAAIESWMGCGQTCTDKMIFEAMYAGVPYEDVGHWLSSGELSFMQKKAKQCVSTLPLKRKVRAIKVFIYKFLVHFLSVESRVSKLSRHLEAVACEQREPKSTWSFDKMRTALLIDLPEEEESREEEG